MEAYNSELMKYIGIGGMAVSIYALVASVYLAVKDISSWRKKDSGLEKTIEPN